MPSLSKKSSLIILGVASLLSSRAMFALFDDPEGPNLLVVVIGAIVLYVPSLVAYKARGSNIEKLALAIFLQIALAIILYFCLR